MSRSVAATETWLLYQPLIVGLGAVVLATLGNTLLEWFRQHLSNRHASAALRRALVEELRLAKETADLNSKRSAKPEPGGSILVPVAERYRVYDENVSKIGLLRPDEVSAVTRAYAYLQAQTETLCVIGQFHRPGGVVLQAVVDSKWAFVLEENNRHLSKVLSAAIDALERR